MGFKDHNIFNNMYFLKAHHCQALPKVPSLRPYHSSANSVRNIWFYKREAETQKTYRDSRLTPN